MSDHPFYFTWTAQLKALRIEIEKSRDCYYLTTEGRKLYDLSSTSYQAAFGHSFSPIKKAIQSQLNSLPISSPKGVFELKQRATQKLIEYLNIPGKIFYTVSGAESIENALKMARQISGKEIILARKNSYHGASLGALSVTGDWRTKDHKSLSKWTKRIPAPQVDPNAEKLAQLIEKIGAQKIAAICLETFIGGNGVISAPLSWWRGLAKLKKKYGFFIILDEVVCGFGRTGKPFGFHHLPIKPDFICMAKIITGGYIPFGAVWTSKKIANYYKSNTLSCGLTNYAHPLGLSAMESVIDSLKTTQLQEQIKALSHGLETYKEKFEEIGVVKEVRVIGTLMAIDLKKNISFKRFIDEDILVALVGQRIIIAPPFTMRPSILKKLLKRIERLLKEDSHE
ncbi:aminotransferase class III-fold pyridoxal phosphate-dependent enzyme [Halobacteriovorax marinus]|uniref:aminotransferase class III-fold pyridoxal phosphate-dependent enzyme n=1 Tax=Halobacteriovorax marinus TaxID=97084 RepID=UPI003A91008A